CAKVGAAYLALNDAKSAADFLTKATSVNSKPLVVDWLVLALAHAKLKDTDQARNACAKAAELFKPAGADDALRPLLREVALTVGTNQPAVQDLMAAAAAEPPPKLNEAVEQNPDQADGYRNRGEWFGQRARWQEAAADFTAQYRLQPTAYQGMRLAFLLIQTGDLDGHRALCQAMLERWGSTDKNGDASYTVKAVLLDPSSRAQLGNEAVAKQLAHLAETCVSGDTKVDWYEWRMNAQGLLHYRSGRFDDALTICRASRERAPTAKGITMALTVLNLAVEAMALHGKGDVEEARRTVAQARSTLQQHVPGLDPGTGWHDVLAAHCSGKPIV
ncbi:MAG: hypothetical protein L0Y70_10930, partial [Gemmataceae bacterium]|nr:hypothetical protein [Gemmataceae bacterium]